MGESYRTYTDRLIYVDGKKAMKQVISLLRILFQLLKQRLTVITMQLCQKTDLYCCFVEIVVQIYTARFIFYDPVVNEKVMKISSCTHLGKVRSWFTGVVLQILMLALYRVPFMIIRFEMAGL
jgi:hypothetical protein